MSKTAGEIRDKAGNVKVIRFAGHREPTLDDFRTEALRMKNMPRRKREINDKDYKQHIETAIPKYPKYHGDNPRCPHCGKILEKYRGQGKKGCTVCPDPECRQIVMWFK